MQGVKLVNSASPLLKNVPHCRKPLQPCVQARALACKQARRICSRFGEGRQEAPALHTTVI